MLWTAEQWHVINDCGMIKWLIRWLVRWLGGGLSGVWGNEWGTSDWVCKASRQERWKKKKNRAQDCNIMPFLEWSLPHDLRQRWLHPIGGYTQYSYIHTVEWLFRTCPFVFFHFFNFSSVAAVRSGLVWSGLMWSPNEIGPIQDWTRVGLVCVVWTQQTTGDHWVYLFWQEQNKFVQWLLMAPNT